MATFRQKQQGTALKEPMTQGETHVLLSAGAHCGVAFGILSKFVSKTHDNPEFTSLNEETMLWMNSIVENILSTSSSLQAGKIETDTHEEGYGAGV